MLNSRQSHKYYLMGARILQCIRRGQHIGAHISAPGHPFDGGKLLRLGFLCIDVCKIITL